MLGASKNAAINQMLDDGRVPWTALRELFTEASGSAEAIAAATAILDHYGELDLVAESGCASGRAQLRALTLGGAV